MFCVNPKQNCVMQSASATFFVQEVFLQLSIDSQTLFYCWCVVAVWGVLFSNLSSIPILTRVLWATTSYKKFTTKLMSQFYQKLCTSGKTRVLEMLWSRKSFTFREHILLCFHTVTISMPVSHLPFKERLLNTVKVFW